eukprot:m.232395 g.232395  ORF g.232395 m.232395 type:complete len:228 (-) comp19274_c0_seq11:1171-1854(-)
MSKNYSQDKSRATDQYKLDSENGGTQTHVPPNTRSPVHATDCKTQSSSTSSPRRRIHSRPKIQPLSQIPCDPTLVSAQDEQEPPQTPSSLSNLTSDGNSSHIQFDILRRLHEGEHRRVDLIEKDGQEMVLKVLVFARENSPDRLKLIRTELDLLKRIDCELIVAHFGSYLYLSAREVATTSRLHMPPQRETNGSITELLWTMPPKWMCMLHKVNHALPYAYRAVPIL